MNDKRKSDFEISLIIVGIIFSLVLWLFKWDFIKASQFIFGLLFIFGKIGLVAIAAFFVLYNIINWKKIEEDTKLACVILAIIFWVSFNNQVAHGHIEGIEDCIYEQSTEYKNDYYITTSAAIDCIEYELLHKDD